MQNDALQHWSPLERAAGTLIYASQSLERSLSPNGTLRWVLKKILFIALIITAALPVILLAAYAAAMLAAIVSNLLFVAAGLAILYFAGRAFTRQ